VQYSCTSAGPAPALAPKRSAVGVSVFVSPDQGSQYTDGAYQAVLQAHGIQASMNGGGSW
jgi:hypothetical protein